MMRPSMRTLLTCKTKSLRSLKASIMTMQRSRSSCSLKRGWTARPLITMSSVSSLKAWVFSMRSLERGTSWSRSTSSDSKGCQQSSYHTRSSQRKRVTSSSLSSCRRCRDPRTWRTFFSSPSLVAKTISYPKATQSCLTGDSTAPISLLKKGSTWDHRPPRTPCLMQIRVSQKYASHPLKRPGES